MTKLLDMLGDTVSGFAKGSTIDMIGGPVDLINSGLKAVGIPTSKLPVGGSDWIRDKLSMKPMAQESTAESAGNMASAFINPTHAAMAAMGGVGKMAAAIKSGTFAAATPGIIGAAQKILAPEKYRQANYLANYVDDAIPAVSQAANRSMFEKTGAYLGPIDEALKAVIPDRNALLNEHLLGGDGKRYMVDPTVTPKLGDLLDHPELYDKYPQLKDVNIKRDNSYGGGSYNLKTNTMTLGSFDGPEQMLSVALHETQHAVQGIEGYSRGGSPSMFLPDGHNIDKALNYKNYTDSYNALKSEYPNFNPFFTTPEKIQAASPGIEGNPNYKAFQHYDAKKAEFQQTETNAYQSYLRTGGEGEARAVQAMRADTSKPYPLDNYDVPIQELTPSPLDTFVNSIIGN